MFQSCFTWLFKLDMHCSQILILTKMKNLNVYLCITTQGLQIRYALLQVQLLLQYNADSKINKLAKLRRCVSRVHFGQ